MPGDENPAGSLATVRADAPYSDRMDIRSIIIWLAACLGIGAMMVVFASFIPKAYDNFTHIIVLASMLFILKLTHPQSGDAPSMGEALPTELRPSSPAPSPTPDPKSHPLYDRDLD